MSVETPHKEYTANQASWKLVKDCVAGSATVKEAGETYLPAPIVSEDAAANKAAYESYKLRANFVNFTGHTKKGMVGMVFRKDTSLELPSELEYLKTNSNGGGLSLDQVVRSVLGNIIETGRYGLLVDYPQTEAALTKAQVIAQNLQANILSYNAESIINWRTTTIGGVTKLSLVVLKEEVEEASVDGFEVTDAIQHRVLRLNDAGVYEQEIYNADGISQGAFEPKDNTGSTWKEIPFTFIGSENNDQTVDEAPLYNLAEINLSHYRDSADWQDSSFFTGQPTLVIAGVTQSWNDNVLRGKVFLGARTSLPLPEGATANLLQASPNLLPAEGMKEKEKQMQMIGAKLIQDGGGIETAEAAKIRFAGENSELATMVGNVEDGLLNCFKWVTQFMGGAEDYKLDINKQFYDVSLDAQQIMAIIQLADRGDINQEDVRTNLRKSGLLDESRTSEDIDSENEDSGNGLLLTDEDDELNGGLENTGGTDPALLEILNAIVGKLNGEDNQTFIPANNDTGSSTNNQSTQPIITVEAPVVNVTLPEGLITIPENMVVVTVEAPQIQVDAPQIDSPVNVVNGAVDKDIKLVYDENGVVQGATSKAVK